MTVVQTALGYQAGHLKKKKKKKKYSHTQLTEIYIDISKLHWLPNGMPDTYFAAFKCMKCS